MEMTPGLAMPRARAGWGGGAVGRDRAGPGGTGRDGQSRNALHGTNRVYGIKALASLERLNGERSGVASPGDSIFPGVYGLDQPAAPPDETLLSRAEPC